MARQPSTDLAQHEYLVFDVETTSPKPGTARIVEAAAAIVDVNGQRKWAWHTLVNPGKRITNSDIHGLKGADVKDAPSFGEFAHFLAPAFYGRVVVGHNVDYDLGVATHEFQRAGISMPPQSALCTMRLSLDLDLGSYDQTLASCLAALSLPTGRAHSALHDVAATAALFTSLIRLMPMRHVDTLTSWLGPPVPPADWAPRPLDPPAPSFAERDGVTLADLDRFPTVADDAVLEQYRRSKREAKKAAKSRRPCPQCGIGHLVTKTRRRDGGTFLSCSRFPACRHAQDA